METPPTDLTHYSRRRRRPFEKTSHRTLEPKPRPDIRSSSGRNRSTSNRTTSGKVRLGRGGLTSLRPQLAAAQPTQQPAAHARQQVSVAADLQNSGPRPVLVDSFIEPRCVRPRRLWLSVLVAVAGHATVSWALMAGRVDPTLGIATVFGATTCSLLLIIAEALQRRSHSSDTTAVSE